MVNLPFVHGAWVGRARRPRRRRVTATVTSRAPRATAGWSTSASTATSTPTRTTWTAALDADAYERGRQHETLQVRVVPGSPNRYEVVGEQGAGVLVVLTVFADVFLLLALVLVLRRRPAPAACSSRSRTSTAARPGGRLERLSPTTYLVVGEVSRVEADAVVLDVGTQQVRVELGGFENPVGYEQPAQVRCRLPESAP